MDADPTVYHTMNGPSEFYVIGSLKNWDITDRPHESTTPTLLVSGSYDEATPLIVGQIHERIPGAEWTPLRGVQPRTARRGAGGFPPPRRGLPADDRLTQSAAARLRGDGLPVAHLEPDAPVESLERGGIGGVGAFRGDGKTDCAHCVTHREARAVDGATESPP
jgi:hypothetical protein